MWRKKIVLGLVYRNQTKFWPNFQENGGPGVGASEDGGGISPAETRGHGVSRARSGRHIWCKYDKQNNDTTKQKSIRHEIPSFLAIFHNNIDFRLDCSKSVLRF
jgi:hypothetical protein